MNNGNSYFGFGLGFISGYVALRNIGNKRGDLEGRETKKIFHLNLINQVFMRRTHSFLILCMISFAATAQDFTKCEIYQFSDNDSTLGKVISETRLSKGRKMYRHDIGYRVSSDCDFFDEMRFPGDEYYFYTDTLLSKKIVIEPEANDSIIQQYYYDKQNTITKEVKTYPIYGSRPKNEHWTTYEYDKEGLLQMKQAYYLITATRQQRGPADFHYYKYNKQRKIILDSSTSNTAITKQNEQILQLDEMLKTKNDSKVDTMTFGGSSYISRSSIKTKYTYFPKGYVATLYFGNGNYNADSFYFNEQNLLIRHVLYNVHVKKKDEKYYYDDNQNLIKVVSMCFTDDQIKSMTRIYKYYK